MKICVVTPYCQENIEWLAQAHASVKSQTIEARHILVCDGFAPARIPDFQGTHIVLPRSYRDDGNTSRLIGCFHAIARCDFDSGRRRRRNTGRDHRFENVGAAKTVIPAQ